LDRIEIVFGAGYAPAAPVGLARHDDRIGAGMRMACAIVPRLPLVPPADDPPLLVDTLFLGAVGRFFGLQLFSAKLPAEANVVEDAKRFIESLRPMRNDAFDERPCAYGLHIDALVLMKLCLGHFPTSLPWVKASEAALSCG